MYLSEICNKALYHISRVPPRCYKPVLMTLIPIITQLLYRRFRMNMYPIFKAYSLDFDIALYVVYQEGGSFIKQRDDQHKLFLIIAGTQTVAFLAFALRNRYFLFPAIYTLSHLIWINYSKDHESIKKARVGNDLKPISFCSMDGEQFFD